MKKIFLLILCTAWIGPLLAQQKTGRLSGYVTDSRTQQPLIGVTIVLEGTTTGTATDENGYYKLQDIPTRTYNVVASFIGYKALTKYDIVITSGNTVELNFALDETSEQLGEVVIQASPFIKQVETPNSVQTLSAQEIKSYPGGNNDIAKVVQSLPGVSGSVGFRNDIIIRGGAPNENVYYLDGVEIPNINHFATQGSAGGPVGMLNVSFIEDVTLTTSAFNARYDNPLSGVLQFKQRTGNPERFQGNIRLSASEVAATVEGPIKNKQTTYIGSIRRSYLQLLFNALELPFLPDYWDYQYKMTHKDKKNEYNLIGLGSIDNFKLNPPGPRKSDETPEEYYAKLAILDRLPVYKQWSSTAGWSWKHLMDNGGYFTLVYSTNILNNEADKFENNDEQRPAILRYKSREWENKLRFEMTRFRGPWTLRYGANLQHSNYTNSTFNRLRNEVRDNSGNILVPGLTIDYKTDINFIRGGIFGQLSGTFLDERLNLSFGLRTDGNSFMDDGLNLLNTLSPRAAIAYNLSSKFIINASAGRYYKVPPYTVLGFRQPGSNQLVNKDAKYIRSDHLVAGIEYLPGKSTRITLEGFYKRYANYPVSVEDSVSLANLGGDFGVLGNEKIESVGLGRTYGLEFLFQQKLTKNFYGILAYTLYFSEYTGFNKDKYIASAWDNRHLISFTGGYKFPRNWELGLRFRYLGSAPYTPIDSVATLRDYDIRGGNVLDYSRLNSRRLEAFNALDIRIDKKWNFRSWSLDIFMEIQNVYNSNNPTPPSYTLARNPDGSIAQPRALFGLPADNSTILPTIGLIVEW